jgi:hypothetical protein
MEQKPPDSKKDPAAFRPVGDSKDRRAADPENLFWQQFVEATTPRAFCQSWLPLQCRMLKRVRCAMVLLGEPDSGPFTPVAVWPDAKLSMHHLTGAAERSLKERRGLLVEKDADPASPNHFPENIHIAYPIEVEGKLHGTVVLGVDETDRNAVQAIMRQLHWGAAWLEVLIRRTQAVSSDAVSQRLEKALDLLASAVENDRFHEAAMALVTRMANRLACDRVSIGFSSGRRIKVTAVSHSADFGKQTNLVRAIGSAMDEAADQQAVTPTPSLSGNTVAVPSAPSPWSLRAKPSGG